MKTPSSHPTALSTELRIGASERLAGNALVRPEMTAEEAALAAQLHILRGTNYRHAHAAATLVTGQDAEFLRLRTLMSLGQLTEAESLASSLRDSADGAQAAEACRLHVFAGRWPALLEDSATLLARADAQVALSTRLGLHQMRALAHYELGQAALARAELRSAMDFVEIVPSLPPSFYCAILERKLLLQERRSPLTDAELVALWRARDPDPGASATLDQALTYLRLKLDSESRHAAPDAWRLAAIALASALTAEALGDTTYEALAWLALLQLADSPDARAHCREKIAASDRATRELTLIEAGGPLSTTLSLVAGLRALPPVDFARLLPLARAKHVWLPELALVVDLERRVCATAGTEQEAKVLALLTANESPRMSKPEFFRKLWGAQAYSARLHDPVIATCLYRMRQKHGLEIRAKDEAVQLPAVVLA